MLCQHYTMMPTLMQDNVPALHPALSSLLCTINILGHDAREDTNSIRQAGAAATVLPCCFQGLITSHKTKSNGQKVSLPHLHQSISRHLCKVNIKLGFFAVRGCMSGKADLPQPAEIETHSTGFWQTLSCSFCRKDSN